MQGLVCGPYRLMEKIGEGGIAEVWLAKHMLLDQKVAIKLLLPHAASQQQFVARFRKEARALAKIKHAGIVSILDVGEANNGRSYIVLELLKGQTLKHLLKTETRLSIADSLRFMHQLAMAMKKAHDARILHRDLKPSNLMIEPDDGVEGGRRIKVLDFGLAKLTTSLADAGLTTPDMILGTPAYMAPEQTMNSGSVDARADLYSLGCVFYHCLCGRAPFIAPANLRDGQAHIILMQAHLKSLPEPPHHLRTEVSIAISNLVMQLMAKQPNERIQTCGELLSRLDALKQPHRASSLGQPEVTYRAPLDPAGLLPNPAARSAAPRTEQAPRRSRRPPRASHHDALTLVGPDDPAAANNAIPRPMATGSEVDTQPYTAHRQAAAIARPAMMANPPAPAHGYPVLPGVPVNRPAHGPVPAPGYGRQALQPAVPYHRLTPHHPPTRRTGTVVAICCALGLAGATLASAVMSESEPLSMNDGGVVEQSDAGLAAGATADGSYDAGPPQPDAMPPETRETRLARVRQDFLSWRKSDWQQPTDSKPARAACAKLLADKQETDSQLTVRCTAIACWFASKRLAQKYYKRIKNPNSRETARNLCKRAKVKLERKKR